MTVLFFLPKPKTAEQRGGVSGFFWRHPVCFLVPVTVFGALSLKLRSIPYVFGSGLRYQALEIVFLFVHVALFVVVPLLFLSLGQAILFMLVNQALSGLYMAAVFATNHIGMPMLGRETQMDFLQRQTLTSRNLRSHWWADILFGGLNYQIEHHLFPTMARKNLRAAHEIVREFCRERSIPYYQTGVVQSYVDILSFLWNAGRDVTWLTPPPLRDA